MSKEIELDNGIELVGFKDKKIKKLLRKGKKFVLVFPGVISRDENRATVRFVKKGLEVEVYSESLSDDDGNQDTVFECKANVKELKNLIYELMHKHYI